VANVIQTKTNIPLDKEVHLNQIKKQQADYLILPVDQKKAILLSL